MSSLEYGWLMPIWFEFDIWILILYYCKLHDSLKKDCLWTLDTKGRREVENNKSYKIVPEGKKAVRRDYSKVSGNLELPNLVEIQTDSFDWFKAKGIQEVFDEIFPIENYNKDIKLNFKGYTFEKPKYDAEQSMYRECN